MDELLEIARENCFATQLHISELRNGVLHFYVESSNGRFSVMGKWIEACPASSDLTWLAERNVSPDTIAKADNCLNFCMQIAVSNFWASV